MNTHVGPVFKTGEVADAAVQAAQDDNPDHKLIIEDHVAYVRIKAESELIIRAKTMEEYLGRPFVMAELETVLAAAQVTAHKVVERIKGIELAGTVREVLGRVAKGDRDQLNRELSERE